MRDIQRAVEELAQHLELADRQVREAQVYRPMLRRLPHDRVPNRAELVVVPQLDVGFAVLRLSFRAVVSVEHEFVARDANPALTSVAVVAGVLSVRPPNPARHIGHESFTALIRADSFS